MAFMDPCCHFGHSEFSVGPRLNPDREERSSGNEDLFMCQAISKNRGCAYSEQHKRCFYCSAPMWISNPDAFAAKHSISTKEIQRFRCTAEHLRARADGGLNTRENIVAACTFCNSRRHRRAKPLTPLKYRSLVRDRIRAGRWHPQRFHHLLNRKAIR